jgi:hypothetical protein
MKRFTAILVALVAMFTFAGEANAQSRNDVVIPYEHLSLDASFKQFKKASKVNQIEILTYLVSRANEEYLKCTTLDDLYTVKENLETIKFYNRYAKQASIAVANAIRKLDRDIIQTEAEIKGISHIDRGTSASYIDRGQDE